MANLSGKSNSLQSKVLSNLRAIFNAAQENGLIAKSPVSSTLKLNGKKTQEKELLTTADCGRLLDKVKNPRARAFLLTALHTGLRRGEILGINGMTLISRRK